MGGSHSRARAPYSAGSGCGGGAWRQLGRTFDVRPWASRSRSSSRSLCPSRARTLPRRRRTKPASEANSEPRTRLLGVARALRRFPTRLGVSNPAPTHSGESTRAFLADPVLVWRLLSGRPCVASPRPRGSRMAALARRAQRAWSPVVHAAESAKGCSWMAKLCVAFLGSARAARAGFGALGARGPALGAQPGALPFPISLLAPNPAAADRG